MSENSIWIQQVSYLFKSCSSHDCSNCTIPWLSNILLRHWLPPLILATKSLPEKITVRFDLPKTLVKILTCFSLGFPCLLLPKYPETKLKEKSRGLVVQEWFSHSCGSTQTPIYAGETIPGGIPSSIPVKIQTCCCVINIDSSSVSMSDGYHCSNECSNSPLPLPSCTGLTAAPMTIGCWLSLWLTSCLKAFLVLWQFLVFLAGFVLYRSIHHAVNMFLVLPQIQA